MELIAVRHGQSTVNAAFAAAEAASLAGTVGEQVKTGFGDRDHDVPLSPLGEAQSMRLGTWFASALERHHPEMVISSPYQRAWQTWQLARKAAADRGVRLPEARMDARLADRRMGKLELLTDREIAVWFPAEAARRRAGDESRYRPPGGESFPDVAARVAPLLAELVDRHRDGRVLLMCHDAVVLALRHLIEGQPWRRLLEVAATTPVANCAVTRWTGDGSVLRLSEFNHVEHIW